MVDTQQVTGDVRVTPRDREVLRVLVSRHGYRTVGAAVGRSKTTVGHLVTGKIAAVSMTTAADLERALDQPVGSLFRLAPAVAEQITPYLR